MIRLLWDNRRTVTLLAAFGVLSAVALVPVGCSTKTETKPGNQCVGGLLRDDGSCEPICDPTQCLESNVCVDNHCRLLCDTHTECWGGVQECQAAITDEGLPVNVCRDIGMLPVLAPEGWPLVGYGVVCPGGDIQCTASACPNGLECDLTACGGNPTQCVRDEEACGELGEDCNIGTCENWDPNDKCVEGFCALSERGCGGDIHCQRCTVTDCETNECTPFKCLGGAGDGDATAYCTHHDCTEDAHCPGGYYCGVATDPRDVCGATCSGGSCSDNPQKNCGEDADCQTGNTSFCGETFEPCLDPSQFNVDGAQFFEGSACLLRNSCIKKEECAPCETNVDCRLGAAHTCVAWGTATVCARFCAAAADCTNDMDCLYYGKTCQASPAIDCLTPADCPKPGDQCLDRSICLPKSGDCRAANATGSKFCHHCVDATDCGAADPTTVWDCVEISYGEHACFDRSFPDSCTVDSDCPQSPSGTHGECLDEGDGVTSSNSVYHRCYFPRDDFKEQYTCW
ncbi:MAG: hypothetical protein DRI90_12430 [Deltaproteobacteria bacterium]|nr:MAG: hypothetical protein DRI90_12430 [Deltaproteobacteria bacterium]